MGRRMRWLQLEMDHGEMLRGRHTVFAQESEGDEEDGGLPSGGWKGGREFDSRGHDHLGGTPLSRSRVVVVLSSTAD